MRLIDADAVFHKINEITGEGWEAGHTAERCYDIVFNAETVDAVPVLRCKDCKYYRNDLDVWCDMYFDPDDFCSCGERKGGAK